MTTSLASILPRRPHRSALAALLVSTLSAAPAWATADLVAFTRVAALRQGAFEAGGIAWSCGGELCSARGPDDVSLWPGLCAAFVREAGTVAAFGSIQSRFDAAALARCNETGAPTPLATAPATPPAISWAAPPAAPPAAATVADAALTASAASRASAPRAQAEAGAELCNGVDDDGDGEVDDGVRVRVWADRDHDLFGDPRAAREVCLSELGRGLVLNDYDCDDADAKRNPARDNCP